MKVSLSICALLCANQVSALLAPSSMRLRPRTVHPSITSHHRSSSTSTADAVDDESALTEAGLLKRDKYIATNRFAVRRNQQAKFEKRWATRKSKLALLDGFHYFQLMRRVTLPDGTTTTSYDAGETDQEAFENYVSFTIWDKKSHFSAWRNGEAFKEAHGGTSIAAFVGTMVNSAFVLRGAPRPAFYDALYTYSQPLTSTPLAVDGWRAVEADGVNTLDAETYMHLTKYYIPAEHMQQFESDYAAVSDTNKVVSRALMRRDARAKGHGIVEMTLDEPSYVAVRIFDDKQAWLDFCRADSAVLNVDYARKPAEVELYEGTLVLTPSKNAAFSTTEASSTTPQKSSSTALSMLPNSSMEPASVRTTATSSTFLPSSRTATRPSSTALAGFFDDLKGLPSLFQKPQDAKPIEPQYDTVVIDPDFRVAGLFLAAGFVLDLIPYLQVSLGPIVTLLGVLFLVQTFRIRFIFDQQNFLELVTTSGNELESSGENVIVGGANRWACDKVVNYDFFPKGWMDGPFGQPILVYFKETQTPPDSWNEGPGKSANDPEKIAAGTGKSRAEKTDPPAGALCRIPSSSLCSLFVYANNSRPRSSSLLSRRLQRQTNPG